ncbi:glycosyltransferase family 4 protein [Jatrophihabitans cynanchi]|uniref:Glycosyltransferase family 4 protein n=1 Tax=Jatrophihabitans cynanchi TaxID=2944128 RepID=A0ABY7JYM1_9ACTN|nr:glycosyltransferase family 4 protein [Jatrophihabitans sp. SB3-54]WAX57656.1 glycosyltransferase family 4 protein [Jatrophihabitans sp. SB3-54]
MRIGLIAPPWVPVPPPRYGGTEAVVDNLARGLSALGHQVVLFTLGDSACPVHKFSLYERAVEPMGSGAYEAAHVLAAYDALADVDIIHDHTLLGSLIGPANSFGAAPRVVTNHGPFNAEALRIFSATTARGVALVAISQAQAVSAGSVPVTAVIHHGIDLDAYRLGPGGGDYLLFVGRMSPDKGVARAVRIAHRAGYRIVIASKVREADERAYFAEAVRPLLRPSDEVLVEEPLAGRVELLRHAPALIDPIAWPEPFGLVMTEALACGTPVLGCPYGAAPEIVDDGVTGFLARSEDDLVAAAGRLGSIDRLRCRAAAAQRFSMQRMAGDHERLYARLLAARPAADRWRHRPPVGPKSPQLGYVEPTGRPQVRGSSSHEIAALAPVTGAAPQA